MQLHYCNWSSQPNVELACGLWTTPAWRQPLCLAPDVILAEDEHGEDRLFYTLYESDDRVDCPGCVARRAAAVVERAEGAATRKRRRWNKFVRSWYLVGQHAGVDLRAGRAIRCAVCQQEHDGWTDSGHVQGTDICAWSCRDSSGRWVIRAGYGSDFDLREFWFIDRYPTEGVDGICDWCIRRLLRDGVIVDSGLELQPFSNGDPAETDPPDLS